MGYILAHGEILCYLLTYSLRSFFEVNKDPDRVAFREALKHNLFFLAYPNSIAKSGKIKPAQCIPLRDTAPTTATATAREHHAAHLKAFHLSAYD